MAPSCDETQCLGRMPIVSIYYFFPQWVLARVLSVYLSAGQTLQASIKVVPVVNNDLGSAQFLLDVSSGSISGFQHLLACRDMVPNMVHSEGWTPLDLALSQVRLDICELLLSEGADPHLHGIGSWNK